MVSMWALEVREDASKAAPERPRQSQEFLVLGLCWAWLAVGHGVGGVVLSAQDAMCRIIYLSI